MSSKIRKNNERYHEKHIIENISKIEYFDWEPLICFSIGFLIGAVCSALASIYI